MKSLRDFALKIRMSRYFYKNFFSIMILIAIIWLIIGSFLYGNFIDTLRSEIIKSNISELSQVKNNMDMHFKEMSRIVVNISNNPEFLFYSGGQAGNSIRTVYELEKYKASNEFIYDIFFYRNYGQDKNRKIYTSNGEVSTDLFFKYLYHYNDWREEDFYKAIDKMDYRLIRPTEPVRINQNMDTSIITCIYPLPINESRPSSVVIFVIEQKALNQLINNIFKLNSGYIYMLDENGKPVFYDSEGTEAVSPPDFFGKIDLSGLDKDVNELEIDNINYSIVKLHSDYNKWDYIMVIKSDQLLLQVYRIKNLFNYSLYAVLFIGTIIAFGLALENHRPLRRLTNNISKINNHPNSKYGDEIEYIYSFIEQTSEKNKNLLKEQFLTDLVNGKYINRSQAYIAMNETSLNFNYSFFEAAVIFIEEHARQRDKENETRQIDIKFDILMWMEDILKSSGLQGYGVDFNEDRSIGAVFNFGDCCEAEKQAEQILCSMQDFFSDSCSLTIGVGGVYEGMERVGESFAEAKKAACYKFLMGKGKIIYYREINESRQNRKYRYPVHIEAALTRALKDSDEDEVKQAMAGLGTYIASRQFSIEAIRCIGYGIINSVIILLDEMHIEAGDIFIEDGNYDFILTFDTVELMLEYLSTFCMKICEYNIEQKELKNFQFKNRIFDIISDSLHSNTLSLAVIASECGVSQSYISRYFKIQTGCSLMQYVDNLRMNEVKELLKDTDLGLREILSRVGYIDEANFIRKFKKIEGITPIKFRQLVRSEIMG